MYLFCYPQFLLSVFIFIAKFINSFFCIFFNQYIDLISSDIRSSDLLYKMFTFF